MVIQKGSMREVISNVNQIVINDEELMRLLVKKPKNVTDIDPLDSSLPNIVPNSESTDEEIANYWAIVNERVLLTNKVDDLEGNSLCRLYITSGRRRANGQNHFMANQQIVIDTFVHEDYQSDLRSEWILDRLNDLLALENIEGSIGKFDYVKSDPASAPSQYQRYVHYYEYSDMKK